MPDSSATPQERGRRFEAEWAERVGGRLTPGSGNQWYAKMDIVDRVITWSCKLTTTRRYTITMDELDEVFDEAMSRMTVPAMAIRIASPTYDIVVLRADDFLRLVTERTKYVKESKVAEKRRRADTPILFRDDDE